MSPSAMELSEKLACSSPTLATPSPLYMMSLMISSSFFFPFHIHVFMIKKLILDNHDVSSIFLELILFNDLLGLCAYRV